MHALWGTIWSTSALFGSLLVVENSSMSDGIVVLTWLSCADGDNGFDFLLLFGAACFLTPFIIFFYIFFTIYDEKSVSLLVLNYCLWIHFMELVLLNFFIDCDL